MTATRPVAAVASVSRPRGMTIALLIICGAQMLIVLDSTIVNVALPSMQNDLALSETGLSWVINAYTLVFGGLLLLGGRIGDMVGRRRAFIIGIVIFVLASLFAGLAQTELQLLLARGLQGAGGALASPAALALIATMFSEGRERNRALGIYSAVSGAAAALGLILGGVLTELLDWRWVFFVNVPLGLALIVLAPRFLAESTRTRGRLDALGGIAVTGGVIALVYGTISASENGWDAALTIGSFLVAATLLVAFVVIERLTAQPLLPLRILRNRSRAGAYVGQAVVSGAFFSSLFFAALFLQRALELSPLWAGLASLPIAVVIGIAAQLSARNVGRIPPRFSIAAGLALSGVGFIWLGAIMRPDTDYVTVLVPLLVASFGIGLTFVPLTITAISGVDPLDSGVASGTLNTAQQVGGSIGLALLVTIATSATTERITELVTDAAAAGAPPGAPSAGMVLDAAVSGWSSALTAAAILCLGGAVLVLALVRSRIPRSSEPVLVAA